MSSVKSGTGVGNHIHLSPLTGLTVNADFTVYGWFRVNNYDNASFGEAFFIGDTLGGSFWGVSPVSSTDDLVAYIYDGVAVEHVITTGETDWIFLSIRHDGGTSDYKFSWRLEGEASLTHHTITANSGEGNFTPFGSVLGASDEGGDINGRKFVIRQDLLSDADLLAESATLAAPPGTPLVYLDLDSTTNVGTNLGTGGNWTVTGTILDDAATPSVAISGATDQPLERSPTAPDSALTETRAKRLVNVAALVLAASSVDQPPPKPRRMVADRVTEERPVRQLRRFPQSVDQPQFLLWAAFLDDSIPPDRTQTPRRSNPITGPAVPVTLLARCRTAAEVPPAEPRISQLRRLPESVDQPPPAKRRSVAENFVEDRPVSREWRGPDAAAVTADDPQLFLWGVVDDVVPDERLARRAVKFPDLADDPPFPRRSIACEPLPPEPRIQRLFRQPESAIVDDPQLFVWGVVDEFVPDERLARRAVKFPDPLAQVDRPQLSRWRSVGDTPREEPRPVRLRTVLPSAAVATMQPLSRWRTTTDSGRIEQPLRRLRGLPESVDSPPAPRRRVAIENRGEDLPRQLRRLPESYVPPPVDDPPITRWRTISDTPAEDLPTRRYRLLLESGEPLPEFVLAGPGGTVYFRPSKQTVTFRGH
jgi:hypothetical protein